MARENQGLQIALIIFVMLTIVLGVTTFVFFGQYQEQVKKAVKFEDDLTKEQEVSKNSLVELNQLKQFIGFAASDSMDVVTVEVNKDVTTYGANYDEANQVYRKLLQYQQKVIDERSVSLADAREEIQTMKDQRDVLISDHKTQMDQATAAQTRAAADLQGERQKFDTGLQTHVATNQKIQQAHEKSLALANTRVEQADTKFAKSQSTVAKLSNAVKIKTGIINAITKNTFEDPHGEIRWVNQHENTVWINLGRADRLGRHTSFSVYSADTSDVGADVKKASIEVTKILGDHLAEARILDDDISDPILPGDLIHTFIWTPGQQEHFALTDGMDVNNDGRSEPQVVRNLISMSGGIIDAEIDDKGNRTGELTAETRYLIIGRAIDAKSSPEVIDARTNIIRDAERLGVKSINLRELLSRSGWKNQAPVIRYGSGANPDDFRAMPPEGVPRKSTGNVSPLFRSRTPPRSTGGSAF